MAMLPAYIFGVGGHDAHIHGLWTKHFAQLLSEGYLYPRLANDLYAGFGSYVFFFYPPISLYFDSIFAVFGKDENFYFVAISLSTNLAVFLSGLAAYYWLKSKVDKEQALIFSLLYMVLPLHLLIDFYITAAVSQVWSYAWLPLIFYGIEKISRGEKYGTPLLAVSLALLVMTNIPIAIIFIPLAVIYAASLLGFNIWRIIPACVLSIALSAIYTFPVLAYSDLVNIDLHWDKRGGLYYQDFFLDKKLFTADGQDNYRSAVLFSCILTYISLSYVLLQIPKSWLKNFIIIISLFVLALCFSFSNVVWEFLSSLQLVQFPRRLLIIPSFFILLSSNSLFKKDSRKIIITITVVFLIANFAIARRRQIDLQGNEITYTKQQFAQGVETFPNYLPGKDLIGQFYPVEPEMAKYPKAKIDNERLEITKWQSRDIALLVSGKKDDKLDIRQLYFPYWKAYIDNVEVPITRQCEFGILEIILNKDLNNTEIDLKLETLPAEKLGIWISTFGFIILCFAVIRDARKKSL